MVLDEKPLSGKKINKKTPSYSKEVKFHSLTVSLIRVALLQVVM